MEQLNRKFRIYKLLTGLSWCILCFSGPVISLFLFMSYLNLFYMIIFIIIISTPIILIIINDFRLQKNIRKRLYEIISKSVYYKFIIILTVLSLFLPLLTSSLIYAFLRVINLIIIILIVIYYLIFIPPMIVLLIRFSKLKIQEIN